VRVLLVDDDRLSRTTIVKMLEHLHTAVSVDEASDGTEALQRYRECGPYDIVLTDYAHPGLNGYLLADAIRKANPAQSIACLTGDIETGREMWQRLKIPTLAKPFEAWQLEEVVEFAAMLVEHREGSFKGGIE
jgi:CheY-like chemotaxis protein